uniref:Fork-head domain-containing protein n=1 Tax=Schistosoma mansoni TaxID=6183 RepID=A0A5K4FB36_SCHMA
MFEYTSDYLAEKLRENWLIRNHSNEFIVNMEEYDDSLTNLNWLQTLNIHEFTSTTSPISPPPTPPLHLFHPIHNLYSSTSTSMTTLKSPSQKFHNYNTTLNNCKQKDVSLFNGLHHRNENNSTIPFVNYLKHRSYTSVSNHNNTTNTTDNNYVSSIALTNKQYKDSPLKCLNNTINFYSNSNPIQFDPIPVTMATNTMNNNNLNCQQLFNTVYMNPNDVNPMDNQQFSIYDLYNNNNNNHSLRNNNLSRFECHSSIQKLRKNDDNDVGNNIDEDDPQQQQQSINVTDINLLLNSSTTHIINPISSQVNSKKIFNHHHQNTTLIDYSNHYQYYITENNKLFVQYDQLSLHEKQIYQNNINYKPVFNSHTLIYMSMNGLKKYKITLKEIYEWIELHFDIIRKHLTSSRCFQRVSKRKEELDGHNDLWRLNSELHNQLLNHKISHKFLLLWQNQIYPKLPDLIDFIEYDTISSEINNYPRLNNDHNDDPDHDQVINDNHNNQSSKRRCINQIDHLSNFNIDQSSQSNSSTSSASELSDLYTNSSLDLLPVTTSDLTLLDHNNNYLNTSLNSIGLNDTIHSNNLLRNNLLCHSIQSLPFNVIEQEQYDLQGLFNEHETYSILNDHFYDRSTSSLSPFDLNDDHDNNTTTNTTTTSSSSTTTTNTTNTNTTTNTNGLFNEIPSLNDFDNDELLDPLDLTIHNMNSRLTHDWWLNNSSNVTQDNLSESMTNFINSTLNELERKEQEEVGVNDETAVERETDEVHQRINEQEDINRIKLHINPLSTEFLTNELLLNQTLSLLSSSSSSSSPTDLTILSPRLLSIMNPLDMIEPPSSTSSTSSTSTSSTLSASSTSSLSIPITCKYSKTNETNMNNEEDAFFHYLNKTKQNINDSISMNNINDPNDIQQENINNNTNQIDQIQNQHWIDHKMNLDDLDHILGLN